MLSARYERTSNQLHWFLSRHGDGRGHLDRGALDSPPWKSFTPSDFNLFSVCPRFIDPGIDYRWTMIE